MKIHKHATAWAALCTLVLSTTMLHASDTIATDVPEAQGAEETRTLPQGTLARRGGIDATIEDVAAFVATKRFPEPDVFLADPRRLDTMIDGVLLNRQLTVHATERGLDKREDIRRQITLATEEILARAYLDDEVAQSQAPDVVAIARERYMVDEKKYYTSDSIRLQQVFVAKQGRQIAEARARAEEALEMIKSHALTLEDAVLKYGEAMSHKTKGESTYPVDRIDAKFLAALEGSSLGTVHPEVIESPQGFHIVRLIERIPGTKRPFEEVLGTIRDEVLKAHDDSIRQRIMAEFRAAPLDANSEALIELRDKGSAVLPKSPAAKAN